MGTKQIMRTLLKQSKSNFIRKITDSEYTSEDNIPTTEFTTIIRTNTKMNLTSNNTEQNNDTTILQIPTNTNADNVIQVKKYEQNKKIST